MSFWNQLRERGVWRNLVLYVGISWGLIQSLDFFASRYQLGDSLVDMLLLCLLGLLPLAMWVGWKLGAPEPSRGLGWRDGLIGLAYAAALAVGLYAGLGGREPEQTSDAAGSIENALANVPSERPRQDLIRAVSLVVFAQEDATSPEWLGLGVAEALMIDLSQHRFLTVSFPWNAELRNAYIKGDGVMPLNLLAQQARRVGSPYFISGKVSGTPASLSLHIEVHQVEPFKLLHTHQATKQSLFQAVDAASVAIKPYLDLSAEGDNDLPIAEMFSQKPEAVAALFAAEWAMLFKDDYAFAMKEIQRALTLDPDFAMAALRQSVIAQSMGNIDIAKAGYDSAMRNLHQLTPVMQCVVRANHAAYAKESDRSQRIAKGCVDMFPSDAGVRAMYASLLALNPATLSQAIEQYEALYALGPANDAALLQLAKLKSLTGDESGAIAALAQYRQDHPEETATASQLADLLSRRGDFDEAEDVLKDAQGRQDSVALTAALSNLYLRQGRFGDAEHALAQYPPSGPAEAISMAVSKAQLLIAGGRERDALVLFDEALQLAPTGLMSQFELQRLSLFSGALLRRDGLPAIDKELARLIPATDELSRANREIYRALVVIHTDDQEALRAAERAVVEFIEGSKREDLRFLLSLIQARQRDAEGKGSEAAKLFAIAHQQMLTSPTRLGIGEGLLLRWWLETARHDARADDLSAAAELAARGFPGHTSLLAARAEAAARQGNITLARDLFKQADVLLVDADADFPARVTLERVRALLAAVN